ncbi:hypothetical protein CDD82_6184 [Ophiocordyceps australis]|uniref:Uncharacterized protein n=1 Tax=Ophiocordyceps australis TaxID=1399860 RepID=A0A2C5YYG1_9HYPO|nr:hypothetical protein CDD82_6184 [Ophiocordyceps australis]
MASSQQKDMVLSAFNGTSAQNRRLIVQFQAWSKGPRISLGPRCIGGPDHLNPQEVFEIFHIVEASLLAHGVERIKPEHVEEFLKDVFADKWHTSAPMPKAKMLVFDKYPFPDKPLNVFGDDFVAHKAGDATVNYVWHLHIGSHLSDYSITLAYLNHHDVPVSERFLAVWKASVTTKVSLKRVIRLAVNMIDAEVQAYNRTQAVKYGHEFLRRCAEGNCDRRPEGYAFINTSDYLAQEAPEFWAASVEEIEAPALWGNKGLEPIDTDMS